MLKGKTIVITGSSGFVGSHLLKKFKGKGARVVELNIRNGIDITDWHKVEGIKEMDILIHLAAKTFVPESFQKSREFLQTNINGTINMLELCKNFNARMIYASSYVYGAPKYLPIDEDHPLFASNPYALSKIAGEELCRGYYQSFGVKGMIVRPFNIYGIGQNVNFLISSIVHQAKNGEIILKDPSPKRDFIYIDDVVDAYLKLVEYNMTDFEVLNIGAGRSYSIQEIVKLVCEAFGNQVKVKFTNEKRKNEIMETVANITKAKKLLDWEPRIDLREGIKRIIDYIK